jgi:hypothetical protein
MTIHDDHDSEINFDTGYIRSNTWKGDLMGLHYVLVMVERAIR